MVKNGIVLGILTIAIPVLIAVGALNHPNFVMVRQTDNPPSVCPNYIVSDFEVDFINDGSGSADLCVNVSSADIPFTRNRDCLHVSNDKSRAPFKFPVSSSVQMTDGMHLVVVQYEWDSYIHQTQEFGCLYNKTSYTMNARLEKQTTWPYID